MRSDDNFQSIFLILARHLRHSASNAVSATNPWWALIFVHFVNLEIKKISLFKFENEGVQIPTCLNIPRDMSMLTACGTDAFH